MFNKKGIIGTGLTWIVATIVIFAIMLIFMIFSSFLYNPFGDKEIGLSKLDKSGNYNYEVKFATSFYEQNKKVIFDWADYDGVVSFADLYDKETNQEAKKVYDNLYNDYVKFVQDAQFKEPYFYIRTNEKEMLVNKLRGEDFSGWAVKNPGSGDFFHNFKVNPLIQDNNQRVFFVSDKGELVMIIFYDKNIEWGK